MLTDKVMAVVTREGFSPFGILLRKFAVTAEAMQSAAWFPHTVDNYNLKYYMKTLFITLITALALNLPCFGVQKNENIILEMLLSLSGDYLKENGICMEYTVEVNSKDHAKYIQNLTGLPFKDIIYIDKNENHNAIFYKNGTYTLKSSPTDSPDKWNINIFDGKNYFSYSNEKKFGQVTKTAPNNVVPNFFDILTKIPQSLNIPKYWKSYLDYIPANPDKIIIEHLPDNDIQISFKPENSEILFDFYLKKQPNGYFPQEIRLFSQKKVQENLLVKVILSNYNYINDIKKYFPFEIKVEYYTMEGELLLDGKTAHLDKVLERVDKIHVKKISIPNTNSLKIQIPSDAVIHDFNIGKTIYLEKIFDNNKI